MKRNLLVRLCLLVIAALAGLSLRAQVTSLEAHGWLEAAYATWSPVAQATDYQVQVLAVSPTAATQQVVGDVVTPVRQYEGYLRADAIGLRPGTYQFQVVPCTADGPLTDQAVTSAPVEVLPHDRAGFAHVGMQEGLGAYQNDGTLRPGARVLYVWAGNARTVTCPVITSSKGSTTVGCGLQDIISLYQKGYDTTPLAIRIIGTVRAADMDRFDSSAEGLQIKGKSEYSPMPITLEGVGCDATLHGFGILGRNCHGLEIRNLAIMLCMDDCISLDTGNSNVWIHHCDFFYGSTGGDADQAKGDGTVDIKGLSRNVTLSYCHFWDCGKSSLGGMKGEDTSCWHTYHHNWFDHSDSRHPRVRTMFFHIYNNYYDGNAKYGVGMTSGGSALVEANVFRNCRYPMLISRQGTDAEGDGTFSGEDGGVIKAYANQVSGARKLQYYDGQQTDGRWDAVLVTSRDEAVTAVAYSGQTPYNAEADLAARTQYTEEHILPAEQVVECVTGPLGAGRMQHGDFQWTFTTADDADYSVNSALKEALQHYQPSVLGFADGTSLSGEGSGTDPDPNPGEGGGEDPGTGVDPQPIQDEVICHFLERKPSSAMVTVSGNYSNSKGTVTYRGQDYGICLKMESATEIAVTPSSACNVTLWFGPSEGGKRFRLDGTQLTTESDGHYTFTAEAGRTYQLRKGDSINLFLIVFTPQSSDLGQPVRQDSHPTSATYDVTGRREQAPHGLVIHEGRIVFVQ